MGINTASFFNYPGDPAQDHRQAPAFAFMTGRDPADWAALHDYTIRRRFEAGEVLIDPRQPEPTLYLLREGQVDLLLLSPSGQLARLATLGPGSLVGEAAFCGGPTVSHAQAATPGEAAALTMPRFEALALREPALARLLLLELGRWMAHRLGGFEHRAAEGAR